MEFNSKLNKFGKSACGRARYGKKSRADWCGFLAFSGVGSARVCQVPSGAVADEPL